MAEDRRTRRTRRALKDALVELALEHGFSNVTVEDITEHADISRATFYKYYRDRNDLLSHIVTDLQEEFHQRLLPMLDESSRGFTGKPVLELFRHALAERDTYRMILRGAGDGAALREFTDRRVAVATQVFVDRARFHGIEFRIDPEVLGRAWVGEQNAVLQWWLETDPPVLTPEEVAGQLLDLSLRGRLWASGFDDEPDTLVPGGFAE